MVLRCEYQMSQASGWQEIHLSATNGRRGLVEQSRLHNEQRGARASLVCSLSALARVSGSGELVRLQEHGRSLGDGTCRTLGLMSRPLQNRWAWGTGRAGLQEPATNRRTHALSRLALLHGYKRFWRCYMVTLVLRPTAHGVLSRLRMILSPPPCRSAMESS